MKTKSPPAWTQEAYRPPCSEYSFCCPIWVPPPYLAGGFPVGGTLPGYPLPGYPPVLTPARVPPCPGWGVPYLGTPPARVPPHQGTLPPGHPPGWTRQGTPQLDLVGYPLPAAPWHSGKCCKALWDMGTPQVWTDWKHYLPHPSDAGGNNYRFGWLNSNTVNSKFYFIQSLLKSWTCPYLFMLKKTVNSNTVNSKFH